MKRILFAVLIVLLLAVLLFTPAAAQCDDSSPMCNPGGYPVPTQPTLSPNCRLVEGRVICKIVPVTTPPPALDDDPGHTLPGIPVDPQPTIPPGCIRLADGRVACKQ